VFVVGTAGHVDHGKTALVKALTGMNPDRLREERERQMTIDLGFAWMTLPSGAEISLIDVPGHEDFVKNMLAGIGGVDAALLVIAADEAVMPQTREHLAILDLFGIQRGVVALTKIDLVHDKEWIALVKEEVRDLLRGTTLAGAAILPVSAVTGLGLDALRAEIDCVLGEAPPRRDIGRPRLPVDRVFTVAGFGTVVTGTLADGSFSVGDNVVIMPGGEETRIRGLQTHKTDVERVTPGFRVAMNLGRVSTDRISRGQVITWPGRWRATRMFDARLQVLGDVRRLLKHDAALDLHLGSARVATHVRLLDAESAAPGESVLVQLRLSEPVVAARGDRFIVRQPSPSRTVGGGEILFAHPSRRYRRFDERALSFMRRLETGEPREVLRALLGTRRAMLARDLVALSDLAEDEAYAALTALIADGSVVALTQADSIAERGALVVSTADAWAQVLACLEESLADFHRKHPLRAGMPREELRSRMHLDAQLLNGVLARASRDGRLRVAPSVVSLASYVVTPTPEQARAVAGLLRCYEEHPTSPPTLAQAEEMAGADIVAYLCNTGRLVKIGEDLLFTAEARDEMERQVVAYLEQHGEITVAQARDLIGASRRYALGLLEDLDRRRVTKRIGDVRVLR